MRRRKPKLRDVRKLAKREGEWVKNILFAVHVCLKKVHNEEKTDEVTVI